MPELLVSVPYVVPPPAFKIVPPLPPSKVILFAASKPTALEETNCKLVPSPYMYSPGSPSSNLLLAPKITLSLKVTLLLASSITAFEAGRVQNTFLVPAEKSTNASELEEEITVVLANVPAATVPRPTSNSVELGISIA